MALNQKSIAIVLASGLIATAAATSAGAFGGHGRHGGGRHGSGVARLEHRLEKLDLPADARAKAFAIVDASRSEDRALRERIRTAREQLRSALDAGAPDADALDAQVEALGQLQTQHRKHFLHTLIEVGAVLPDEARAKWFSPPHRGGGRRGERAR